MKLTPNFDAKEFDVHEPWPAQFLDKRARLATLAQWFRDLAGRPAIVTSAYRSPERNASVGGADHSQHTAGEALDLTFVGISDRELTTRLLAAERAGTAPAYGQFIVYEDTGHTHISLGTKREKLVAYKSGGVRKYRTISQATDVPRVGQTTVQALVVIACSLALFAWLLLSGGTSHVR